MKQLKKVAHATFGLGKFGNPKLKLHYTCIPRIGAVKTSRVNYPSCVKGICLCNSGGNVGGHAEENQRWPRTAAFRQFGWAALCQRVR